MSSPRPTRLAPLALALLLLASACSRWGGDDAAAADSTALLYRATPPSPPSYTVIDVNDAGTVRGTVSLGSDRDVRSDTVVRMIADQNVCGARMRIPLVRRRGDLVSEVIVWLRDAHRGKAMPVERRFDIATEDCALDPRVQAVVVGGTLNVFNGDPAPHRSRFLRAGTDSTLALVRETDAGQVVPVRAALAAPGLVEVRCDVHPHTHGWIRVFDQPYFDVTDRRGRFTLEDVPPGTYHLVAWHPRLGRTETIVRVREGEDVAVELKF